MQVFDYTIFRIKRVYACVLCLYAVSIVTQYVNNSLHVALACVCESYNQSVSA